MGMVEAVRDAILTWDPNEEENLDEGAVRQVAAYLVGTDYKVEDIIRSDKGPDERLSDDNIYFLYDAFKWTRAEQEIQPGETVVLKLEDLG
jgi:hypothetical protein